MYESSEAERTTAMTISQRIRKIANEKGMTQIEFARATGISQSTISDWGRKNTNPSADKIMVICKTLGVSPYELLQDTMPDGMKKVEHTIISEGTEEFLLLETFKGLTRSNKDRLIGYLHALK